MNDAIPDSLKDLVDDLLPWASRMPTINFYTRKLFDKIVYDQL